MKKIISLLIALSIIFGIQLPAFATETEVNESAYYADIMEVKTIGIMKGDENGNFKPTECLTRAEFAKIISDMDNGGTIDLDANTLNSPFYDLPKDHWAIGYISYVVERGFMSGYPDGSFKPDECITGNEAIKVLVSLTGYDYQAVAQGGYPYGYQSAAKTLGIVKGNKINLSDYLYRDETAHLINNTLDVPYMRQTGITDGGADYTSNKNETFLYVKYNMKKDKGIVNATDTAVIGVNETVDECYVKIDSEVLKYGDTSANEYLGYSVRYIYSINPADEDDKTIIYINNDETEVKEILSDDYISFVDNELSYEIGDDVKEISVSTNADYILNGDNTSYYDGIFDIDLGKIKLISTKNSKIYDVVIIESYEVMSVYSVDKERKLITDKYNNSYKLDLSDDDIKYIIKDYNGNAIDLSQIKPGSIISAAMGSQICVIYVGAATVKGAVTGIGDDGIEINDKAYKANYYSKLNNVITPGNSYTFYLDYFGNIADAASSVSTVNMKYLIKVSEKEKAGDVTLVAKFFNLNKQFEELKFAEKVKVNGETYKGITEANLIYEIGSTAVVEDGISQPVDVEITDGEITALNSAKTREDLILDGEDGLCLMYEEKERTFYDSSIAYGWEIYATAETPFLIVPTKAADDSEKAYKIMTYKNFNATTTLAGYTFSKESVYPDFVLIKKNAASVAEKFEGHDAIAVVDKVYTTLDEEGNVINKMKLYKGTYGGNGTEVEFTFEVDSEINDAKSGYSISDVSKGDTIRIQWDSDNKIELIEMLYDFDYDGEGSNYRYSGVEVGTYTTISQRNVTDIRQGFMFVESIDGTKTEQFNLSKYTIIVVKSNSGNPQVYKGTADDVVMGDYVINHIISRAPYTLVVYK